MLSSHFVSLRKQVQQVERDNDERSSIPITIRFVNSSPRITLYTYNDGSQLEAIIRISESLAKLTLSPVVQNHHVEEAIRLFKFSTMNAVAAGSADGLSRGELNEEIVALEKQLIDRLPMGWSTSYQALVKEFVSKKGYSLHALERTLFVMEKRELIRFSGHVSSLELPMPLKLMAVRRKRSCTESVFDSVFFLFFWFPVVDGCICLLSDCDDCIDCIRSLRAVINTLHIF